MSNSDRPTDDVFLPGGTLRPDIVTPGAFNALHESIRLARVTRWDCVRSPHIFMGLLVDPDPVVAAWGERLGADLPRLLEQFQGLFHQDQNDSESYLTLHREFMSDNSIRLLREARLRAAEHERQTITPVDLLITLLTTTNSIVADYFERTGLTAARLTQEAVQAEQETPS